MYELIILGSTFVVAVAISLAKVVYDSISQESERQIQYLNSNSVPCYEAGLFVSSGLNLTENIKQRFRSYATNMFENTTTSNTNHEETLSCRNLKDGQFKVSVPTPNIFQDKSGRNEQLTSNVNTKATTFMAGEIGESSVSVERNTNCRAARNNNLEMTSSGEICVPTSSGVDQNLTINERTMGCKNNSDYKTNVGAQEAANSKIKVAFESSQTTSVESCSNSTHNSKQATGSKHCGVPVAGSSHSDLKTSQKTAIVKRKKLNSKQKHIEVAKSPENVTKQGDTTNVNSNDNIRNDPVLTSKFESNSLSNQSILNRNIWADGLDLSDMCKIPNISENIDAESDKKCLVKNTDLDIKILNTMYVQITSDVTEDKQSSPDEEEYFSCEERDNADFNKDPKLVSSQANAVLYDDCESLNFAGKLENSGKMASTKNFSKKCHDSILNCSCEKCGLGIKNNSPKNYSASNSAISVDSTISSLEGNQCINGLAITIEKTLETTQILKKFGDMDRKLNDLTKRLESSNCKDKHVESSVYPTAFVNNSGNISSLTTDVQSDSVIEDCVPNKDFAITNTAIKKTSYQNSLSSLNDMSKKENIDDSGKISGHQFTTENHRSQLINILPSTGAISKIYHCSHRAKGSINSFSDKDVSNDKSRSTSKSLENGKVNGDEEIKMENEIPEESPACLPSTPTGTKNTAEIKHDIDFGLTSVKNLPGSSNDNPVKHGKAGLKNKDSSNVKTSKKWYNFPKFKVPVSRFLVPGHAPGSWKFKVPGHAVQVQSQTCRNTPDDVSSDSPTATSPETVEEICANLLQRIEKNSQMLTVDHHPTENQPIEVPHNSKFFSSAIQIMKKVCHFFKNRKTWVDSDILNDVYASAVNHDDEFFEIGEDSEDYFQYSDSEDHNPVTHNIGVQSNSPDRGNDVEINLCKGCSIAIADALYFPCGHNYLCVECATTVLRFFKKCCICRKKIDSVQPFSF